MDPELQAAYAEAERRGLMPRPLLPRTPSYVEMTRRPVLPPPLPPGPALRDMDVWDPDYRWPQAPLNQQAPYMARALARTPGALGRAAVAAAVPPTASAGDPRALDARQGVFGPVTMASALPPASAFATRAGLFLAAISRPTAMPRPAAPVSAAMSPRTPNRNPFATIASDIDDARWRARMDAAARGEVPTGWSEGAQDFATEITGVPSAKRAIAAFGQAGLDVVEAERNKSRDPDPGRRAELGYLDAGANAAFAAAGATAMGQLVRAVPRSVFAARAAARPKPAPPRPLEAGRGGASAPPPRPFDPVFPDTPQQAMALRSSPAITGERDDMIAQISGRSGSRALGERRLRVLELSREGRSTSEIADVLAQERFGSVMPNLVKQDLWQIRKAGVETPALQAGREATVTPPARKKVAKQLSRARKQNADTPLAVGGIALSATGAADAAEPMDQRPGFFQVEDGISPRTVDARSMRRLYQIDPMPAQFDKGEWVDPQYTRNPSGYLTRRWKAPDGKTYNVLAVIPPNENVIEMAGVFDASLDAPRSKDQLYYADAAARPNTTPSVMMEPGLPGPDPVAEREQKQSYAAMLAPVAAAVIGARLGRGVASGVRRDGVSRLGRTPSAERAMAANMAGSVAGGAAAGAAGSAATGADPLEGLLSGGGVGLGYGAGAEILGQRTFFSPRRQAIQDGILGSSSTRQADMQAFEGFLRQARPRPMQVGAYAPGDQTGIMRQELNTRFGDDMADVFATVPRGRGRAGERPVASQETMARAMALQTLPPELAYTPRNQLMAQGTPEAAIAPSPVRDMLEAGAQARATREARLSARSAGGLDPGTRVDGAVEGPTGNQLSAVRSDMAARKSPARVGPYSDKVAQAQARPRPTPTIGQQPLVGPYSPKVQDERLKQEIFRLIDNGEASLSRKEFERIRAARGNRMLAATPASARPSATLWVANDTVRGGKESVLINPNLDEMRTLLAEAKAAGGVNPQVALGVTESGDLVAFNGRTLHATVQQRIDEALESADPAVREQLSGFNWKMTTRVDDLSDKAAVKHLVKELEKNGARVTQLPSVQLNSFEDIAAVYGDDMGISRAEATTPFKGKPVKFDVPPGPAHRPRDVEGSDLLDAAFMERPSIGDGRPPYNPQPIPPGPPPVRVPNVSVTFDTTAAGGVLRGKTGFEGMTPAVAPDARAAPMRGRKRLEERAGKDPVGAQARYLAGKKSAKMTDADLRDAATVVGADVVLGRNGLVNRAATARAIAAALKEQGSAGYARMRRAFADRPEIALALPLLAGAGLGAATEDVFAPVR